MARAERRIRDMRRSLVTPEGVDLKVVLSEAEVDKLLPVSGDPEVAYDDLVRLGRARAAEYTWERCATQTLLAYNGTVMKRGESEPKLHYHL